MAVPMIPNTNERVPANTAEEVNARIGRATNQRVRYFAANPAGVDARLRELEAEWDIERVLAMAGAHPCPSYAGSAIERRARFDEERVALKALRGNFGAIGPGSQERDDRQPMRSKPRASSTEFWMFCRGDVP
jgi:hypothetical protein